MVLLSKEQIENLNEWMPIEGFPKYEVNCREGIVRNSRTFRILKPKYDKDGYSVVNLRKDGKQHTKKNHRLVAEAAFHHYGISSDDLIVMHLDEERNDPRISNLALGTCKENSNFPKAKQRNSDAQKGEKSHMFGKHQSTETRVKIGEAVKRKLSKRVGAYKNGDLIMVFQSTREAGRNGFNQANVSACCIGKHKTHRGYFWKYL